MEGAEGNVFVLRKTYQERAGSKTPQRRQSGNNYNAEPHHSPSHWHADAQNSTPEMHGTVTGFKSEIDNQDWIIAKAEHTIDNSGFYHAA